MNRAVPSVTVLLWTVLAAMIAGLSFSPNVEAKVTAPDVQPRPPLVVVRGLGPVPEGSLRLACRSILAQYPVRCEIRPNRSLVNVLAAWDGDREQLDARLALELLFRDRAPDALAELNITPVDIYEEGKPYVFGLASLIDRVSIVSISRIDDDIDRLPKRLTKLVLHEIGHTMGLPHHDDHDCVMRQDPTPQTLDTAPASLCEACHRSLQQHAHRMARAGQLALDRARSHLARGEHDNARQHFVRTLWSGEFDHDVMRGFAIAFFEARQYNESISIMRFVLKTEPNDAQAHVTLGLALQMRGQSGDRDRAIVHFERALDLRPNWVTVEAHLQDLRPPPSSAQGPK